MGDEILEEIANAMANLERSNKVVDLVKQAIEEGNSANNVLERGLRNGLDKIAKKYADGEYFLSELLFASSVMQDERGFRNTATQLMSAELGKSNPPSSQCPLPASSQAG